MIDRLVRRAAEGLPTPGAATTARSGAERSTPPPLLAGRRVQRAETMGSLLKSIASIVIFTVFGITAIAELGYPVGPLIASAGIVGVALGFGAQSLVKDFLSGIFMIFEDQYGVGDVGRPRRGRRHRRGGRPAGHPAPRRRGHRLVRPQRRDPAGRQP